MIKAWVMGKSEIVAGHKTDGTPTTVIYQLHLSYGNPCSEPSKVNVPAGLWANVALGDVLNVNLEKLS